MYHTTIRYARGKGNLENFNTRTLNIWPSSDLNYPFPPRISTSDKVELYFYKKYFTDYLNQININYIKNYHKEKVCTMKQFMKKKRYAPEDILVNIGGNATPEDSYIQLKLVLDALFNQLDGISETYNSPFTILGYAIHYDKEGIPHAHIRRVWHWYNKEKKYWEPSMDKALQENGFSIPNSSIDEGRYNNRRITLDYSINKDIKDYNDMEKYWDEIGMSQHLRDVKKRFAIRYL